MEKNTAATIQMSGSPRHLIVHGEIPDGLTKDFSVSFDSGKYPVDEKKCRFSVRKDKQGLLKNLKARLPAETPPGKYKAAIKCETKKFDVDIEVQEKVRLKIDPINIHLTGKPCEKVVITFVFTNKGNVAINIPEKSIVGVYDDDGVESAFASAYKMDSNDFMELMQKFIEKLRSGHGGLLKVRVLEGAGKLAPDTRHSVRTEFQIPDGAKRGHKYHGVWSVGPAEYAITLTVTK